MFRFVNSLFGCAHSHCTFPITATVQRAVSDTYVVCLDCGKEFPYDWQQMKRVAPARHRVDLVVGESAGEPMH
jgi:predicted transcriptional regulator